MKEKWYQDSSDFNKCINEAKLLVSGRFENDNSYTGKFVLSEKFISLDDVKKLFSAYWEAIRKIEEMEVLLNKVAVYSTSLNKGKK